MKATFAYDPQNADELELKMGDIVEIIKDVSSVYFKLLTAVTTCVFFIIQCRKVLL